MIQCCTFAPHYPQYKDGFLSPSLHSGSPQFVFNPKGVWEITRSDQRIWMNHSVVCGPLAPGRVTAWLDFPLSGAILCNVTDTSLKQHCHSLLSGSIFSYWHFPVGEEQRAYQRNETSEGILPLLFPASMKGRQKKLHWQKYEAAFLCRELAVTAFWYR